MRSLVARALILFFAVTAAQANSLVIESSPDRVSLLELYTSEGCSSCPPADRWLSGLLEDDRLWNQLVPVAFHVDYWDNLGWQDRYARSAHSQRQRALARNGQISTVYTPGLVLDGREWQSWFRRRELVLEHPVGMPGRLKAEIGGQRMRFEFMPTNAATAPTLHVALLGFGLTSQIGAGENKGRRLHHDFVVLHHQSLPFLGHGEIWIAETPLPDSSAATSRRALAAWVTEVDTEVPIQAVGGWLPKDTSIPLH
jgi:hypothetical protein